MDDSRLNDPVAVVGLDGLEVSAASFVWDATGCAITVSGCTAAPFLAVCISCESGIMPALASSACSFSAFSFARAAFLLASNAAIAFAWSPSLAILDNTALFLPRIGFNRPPARSCGASAPDIVASWGTTPGLVVVVLLFVTNPSLSSLLVVSRPEELWEGFSDCDSAVIDVVGFETRKVGSEGASLLRFGRGIVVRRYSDY